MADQGIRKLAVSHGKLLSPLSSRSCGPTRRAILPVPASVAEFFRLPDNAVVELGTRVQI